MGRGARLNIESEPVIISTVLKDIYNSLKTTTFSLSSSMVSIFLDAIQSSPESLNTKCLLDTLSSSSISSCAGCSGNITPASERAGGSSKIPPSLLLISLSSEIGNVSYNLKKKCQTTIANQWKNKIMLKGIKFKHIFNFYLFLLQVVYKSIKHLVYKKKFSFFICIF